MDSRVVRYFLEIVDEGSFTAAAATLLVAQPSLSRQIRQFEGQLGFELFDRSSKRISLTASGRAFLPVARELANSTNHAIARAGEIRGGKAYPLTVVAAAATISDIIVPLISSSGPDGLITGVLERSPELVYSALTLGEADLAVGTLNPPSDLASTTVGSAYLWGQCAPDHPMAQKPLWHVEEIVQHPLILMTRDHGVRRMFDEAVNRADLRYHVAMETTSAPAAQALARSGHGLCILSDDPTQGLYAAPIRADGVDLKFSLRAVWMPKHFAADRIKQSVRDLTRIIGELYPQPSADGQSVPLQQ